MNMQVTDFFGDTWRIALLPEYKLNMGGMITCRVIMLNMTTGELFTDRWLPVFNDWWPV